MRRIDPETVRKILDTADIVEVVSDFVNLKRRGNSYIGLCPFHNERTPSFSVSKAKGYCKCFSCGKGGSAVGFIMEHEQLSYGEALRWLANKYGIEVEEEELTPEQLAASNKRESMLALNEFALTHFEHNLTETTEGRNVGLAYFRRRGLTDAAIKRFRLGFGLEQHDALAKDAQNKGYSDELLVETGLCGRSQHGGLYDRYRGRVIYPIFALSGKVIGFGGRTLRTDKSVAKYVNSPESIIYHKSNQLYGLYQARRAIVNADKCILVEGYMDVISMAQRGVENVVASSGTSLTDGQIALIHRFTQNVTVIYDSDAAGIKASLRGIDMLLAEGLNIKVMLLPDGDDPDSFAQAHSLDEIQAYMAENETDFLTFKARVLLKDVNENDPIGRARVITDIARSIAVIPDDVVRNEYVRLLSRMLQANENTIALQVAKIRDESAGKPAVRNSSPTPPQTEEAQPAQPAARAASGTDAGFLRPCEGETLRMIIRYGMLPLCEAVDNDGNTITLSVLDYVGNELGADGITFANGDFASVFEMVRALSAGFPAALAAHRAEFAATLDRMKAEGMERIRSEAKTVIQANQMEKELQTELDSAADNDLKDFAERYTTGILASDPDDSVRRLVTDMAAERHVLSKMHTKHSRVETERDCLTDRVPKAVYAWKSALLELRKRELQRQLAEAVAAADHTRVLEIMAQQKELLELVAQLAKYLGERIVLPRK